MKYLSLILISTFIVGCFASKTSVDTAEPSAQDVVNNAMSKFPGYSVDQYNQGMQLYEANCTLCHAAKVPADYTEDQWSKLVPGMSEKANNKKGTSITKADEDLIFKYVVSVMMNDNR